MGAKHNLDDIRYRLTVSDFHKMGDAGIFTPDARIELIEGEIVAMAPIGSLHAGIVHFLTTTISQQLGENARLNVQNPIVLGDKSEPIPDIAIVKPRDDFYRNGHPTCEDILCLIEVADTSARYDRETKLPLYAANNIPEVWLVLPNDRLVEIHRSSRPARAIFEKVSNITEGIATVATVKGVQIAIERLFGKS